jgi:DNA-binding FadR family transcriptional regulator
VIAYPFVGQEPSELVSDELGGEQQRRVRLTLELWTAARYDPRVTLGDLAAGLQLLEPLCAAECARRADRRSAVVSALQASVEECATFAGRDGADFTRAARRFHALVVASTPNATLRCVVSTLVALWTAQEESWAEAVSRRGEYPSDDEVASVVKVHQRIVDDIAAGRPDEAERVARKHLAASQAFLVDRFDDGIVNAMLLKSRPAISPNRASL